MGLHELRADGSRLSSATSGKADRATAADAHQTTRPTMAAARDHNSVFLAICGLLSFRPITRPELLR